MNPLLEYYAACFDRHADTAQGAGWPSDHDRQLRFDVVLELIDHVAPTGPVIVCDLGCGTGELLRRILQRGEERIIYKGADGLEKPLAVGRRKFPNASFHHIDIVTTDSAGLESLMCDVLVANGVFTVKSGMSEKEMWSFMTEALLRVWPLVRRGLIFNVMSPIVEWRRNDLFHVSYDRLAGLLHGLAGRSIGFRADYGLYEYMAYATKTPWPFNRFVEDASHLG